MRTLHYVAIFLAVSAQSGSAQLKRDCGNTQFAVHEIDHVRPFFFDGGEYATVRQGKWQQLPANIAHGVMSVKNQCRPIVDLVNERITSIYDSSSLYRTRDLWHMMFNFTDLYFVVIFGAKDVEGPAAFWVYQHADLGIPPFVFVGATLY